MLSVACFWEMSLGRRFLGGVKYWLVSGCRRCELTASVGSGDAVRCRWDSASCGGETPSCVVYVWLYCEGSLSLCWVFELLVCCNCSGGLVRVRFSC